MKLARFVLKIVGASLALAGMICLTIGYWDKLLGCCASCKTKLHRPKEYDDFADVD